MPRRTDLKKILLGTRMYENTPEMDASKFDSPTVTFCFSNGGKTPAILTEIRYGLLVKQMNSAVKYAPVVKVPIEVLETGEENEAITCTFVPQFNFGMAKALRLKTSRMIFFGSVTFTDVFGKYWTVEWECNGSIDGYKLIYYRQSRNQIEKV